MKKVVAQIALITLALSFSFFSFGQRTSDIGIGLSTDQQQRFIFEYRKPIKEKWRLTLGAVYGHYNYRSGGRIVAFSDSLAELQSSSSTVHKGSLRIGVDRQFGNSIFSIGTDLLLNYKSRYNYYHSLEYTQDTSGISLPYIYGGYSPEGGFTAYRIHYLGAGLQITGKMDLPINDKFSLNLFVGPAISLNSSFKIDNIMDPNNELEYLNDMPRISTLDLDLVAGIGLKYAVGK
jgi:hypothetical protein